MPGAVAAVQPAVLPPMPRRATGIPVSARYWSAEVAVLLLNAANEGEHTEVAALIGDMTDHEAKRVLPALVTVAATALRYLPPDALEAWRAMNRKHLAALPCPQGGAS